MPSSKPRGRSRRTPASRDRRPAAATRTRSRRSLRGSAPLRLRTGFVFIAVVLSFFGARLVQLQGLEPEKYATLAASTGGTVTVELPAERGDILDRNGRPLADSVAGRMVVVDPLQTQKVAPQLARFLAKRLHVDWNRGVDTPDLGADPRPERLGRQTRLNDERGRGGLLPVLNIVAPQPVVLWFCLRGKS